MRHPILLALGAGALVLTVALALPLWQMLQGPQAPPPASSDLPWQAQALPDGGLRVFGLQLGHDTLADARARLGDGLQVALVARLGETGALEALVDPFGAGHVSGRLVLSFDVPPATRQRWREAAPRSEAMDGGARRFALARADQAEAGAAPLSGVVLLPSLRLSEADVRQRFGAPAQVIALEGDARQLLYPQIGLAASVGSAGRAVLQFVAPRDFASRLAGAASAAR